MSATLYMQPRQTGEKALPDELRHILMKPGNKFGDLPVIVDDYSLDYFQALADADIKGAQKVVDAINKYGELEIRAEY